MREDPFGDLDLLRFAGEPRGGVIASATTRFGDGLLRGLLRNARVDGIENPEYDHGGIPLEGQDGSCDDSVTSPNFNRRDLPILTSGVRAPICESQTDFVKTDFLYDGGRNSDFLHSQPAARALSSSSRPGQSGDARRDGLCELCSPREGDVGCDPVNTLEHLGLF